MFRTDVVPGVHLLQYANVNCYLIEDGDALTLVDAGLPGAWTELGHAVRHLGRAPEDIQALVLTHAHFDHIGLARRLVKYLELPVYAHPAEWELAAHPYQYAHENPRALYPLRHPRAIPFLASMVAAGAAWVRGVEGLSSMEPGAILPVPGKPRVVATYGHTFGHCALHLPERDVVLSGDALVTLDPYTGRTGPRIIAGAATADSTMALASLDAIAETAATHLLPGHGAPWHGGAKLAVRRAREHGPS